MRLKTLTSRVRSGQNYFGYKGNKQLKVDWTDEETSIYWDNERMQFPAKIMANAQFREGGVLQVKIVIQDFPLDDYNCSKVWVNICKIFNEQLGLFHALTAELEIFIISREEKLNN